MARLRLGVKPHTLDIVLTQGADFVARLLTKEDNGVRPDWPVDAEARLVFADGSTWDATTTGSAIVFNVQSEQADLIPDGATVTLFYRQGEFDAAWAVGTVSR